MIDIAADRLFRHPLAAGLLTLTLLGGLAFPRATHAQGSLVTTLSDLKGIYLDLDAFPMPTPADAIVTPTADILQQRTSFGDATNQYHGAFAEYDISSLNADGIFSARMVGQIDMKSPTPAGLRQISPEFYEANGIVQGSDAFAAAMADPTRIYPTLSYDAPAETSVAVDIDVTKEVREAIRRGASHFGARFQGSNSQGLSTIDGGDPIDLEITEYYANPIDAAPEIVGPTGLSFRGQAGEFVSQGETRLLSPDTWTFELDRNFDAGISVTVRSGLDRWNIDFAAPGNALLQIGDTFDATRWPFHDDTIEGGFEFRGEGRGLNASTSTFTINDVAYDAGGNVLRLDAEFIQRSLDGTNFGAPVLVGRIKVNAVPEPATCVLLAVGFGSVAWVRRRRSRRRELPIA